MAAMTTRTVSRAFEVLEALAAQPQGLRLHDLSHAVGLHKSTVFRLVRTLVQLGYVRQAYDRDLYALSPAKRLVDVRPAPAPAPTSAPAPAETAAP